MNPAVFRAVASETCKIKSPAREKTRRYVFLRRPQQTLFLLWRGLAFFSRSRVVIEYGIRSNRARSSRKVHGPSSRLTWKNHGPDLCPHRLPHYQSLRATTRANETD